MIADLHTHNPLGGITQQPRHVGFVLHLGTSAGRGVDEKLIKDVAARCVERVYAGARPERDDGLFTVGIAEDHLANSRRTGRSDIGKYAPARQLQHSGAHQSMG